MTIIAEKTFLQLLTRVLELLSLRRQLVELAAAPLGENEVASVAVVPLNDALAVEALMLAVMTPETAWPVFMPDVVRVNAPVGLHFRKEIVPIDFLRGG